MESSKAIHKDAFSRNFLIISPILIPFIVYFGTLAFYPICPPKLLWCPLLVIYWLSIWGFTLLYRAKRGGVFSSDRFKLNLKLQGEHVGWQYLLVYGPLAYNIPLFFLLYAKSLSLNMALAILAASLINGPSEEIFWRACMDDAGTAVGLSEKQRLLINPIQFAFWHTAFVIHLYPHDSSWVFAWFGILLTTWSSGLIWQWAMHKSKRIVPQCFIHICANFFGVFPMILITVVQFSF